jgi:hypothetical protein
LLLTLAAIFGFNNDFTILIVASKYAPAFMIWIAFTLELNPLWKGNNMFYTRPLNQFRVREE